MIIEKSSLNIIRRLKIGYSVFYHDKYIPKITDNREYKELVGLKSIKLSKKILKFDLTILLTD